MDITARLSSAFCLHPNTLFRTSEDILPHKDHTICSFDRVWSNFFHCEGRQYFFFHVSFNRQKRFRSVLPMPESAINTFPTDQANSLQPTFRSPHWLERVVRDSLMELPFLWLNFRYDSNFTIECGSINQYSELNFVFRTLRVSLSTLSARSTLPIVIITAFVF